MDQLGRSRTYIQCPYFRYTGIYGSNLPIRFVLEHSIDNNFHDFLPLYYGYDQYGLLCFYFGCNPGSWQPNGLHLCFGDHYLPDRSILAGYQQPVFVQRQDEGHLHCVYSSCLLQCHPKFHLLSLLRCNNQDSFYSLRPPLNHLGPRPPLHLARFLREGARSVSRKRDLYHAKCWRSHGHASLRHAYVPGISLVL